MIFSLKKSLEKLNHLVMNLMMMKLKDKYGVENQTLVF